MGRTVKVQDKPLFAQLPKWKARALLSQVRLLWQPWCMRLNGIRFREIVVAEKLARLVPKVFVGYERGPVPGVSAESL